jgi:hypothetical protein
LINKPLILLIQHSGEGPRITVVLDLDVAKAASAFVETINAYAA